MIILIGGASHTGKTAYAQKLLEQYKYPVAVSGEKSVATKKNNRE